MRMRDTVIAVGSVGFERHHVKTTNGRLGELSPIQTQQERPQVDTFQLNGVGLNGHGTVLRTDRDRVEL